MKREFLEEKIIRKVRHGVRQLRKYPQISLRSKKAYGLKISQDIKGTFLYVFLHLEQYYSRYYSLS